MHFTMSFERAPLECEWKVIKLNCTGEVVTKDACRESPDNVATMIACYLCNDNNAYAISRHPPVYSALLAYLVTQIWPQNNTPMSIFVFHFNAKFCSKLSGITCC